MRLAEFKTRLDRHYAAGYEDFCANAKEAYAEMDFDSFMILTIAKSSVLPTSSEDINLLNDVQLKLPRMIQSLGLMLLVVYPSNFIVV
ncbi:hypothetical protein SO802_026303 [Lithocarpus litseifolius]|uniref:Uncharacterized protein n=1 Tax=Lithocarpus litseifolius TaxID=425828 RepID=A0AAW2C0T6_9ROSI